VNFSGSQIQEIFCDSKQVVVDENSHPCLKLGSTQAGEVESQARIKTEKGSCDPPPVRAKKYVGKKNGQAARR